MLGSGVPTRPRDGDACGTELAATTTDVASVVAAAMASPERVLAGGAVPVGRFSKITAPPPEASGGCPPAPAWPPTVAVTMPTLASRMITNGSHGGSQRGRDERTRLACTAGIDDGRPQRGARAVSDASGPLASITRGGGT
jgi:hypothetical protein